MLADILWKGPTVRLTCPLGLMFTVGDRSQVEPK